jgi:hypothetical protein
MDTNIPEMKIIDLFALDSCMLRTRLVLQRLRLNNQDESAMRKLEMTDQYCIDRNSAASIDVMKKIDR